MRYGILAARSNIALSDKVRSGLHQCREFVHEHIASVPRPFPAPMFVNTSMKSRTAEARLRVLHPITAEATQLSSPDEFPIPATSRMIELMEMAAARLMRPRLDFDESSVAVAMNITYAAPQLRRPNAGCTLRAVASYKEITGKLHRFTINAFDESGLIGTAEHTRAVLIERRLTDVAREQAGKGGVPVFA